MKLINTIKILTWSICPNTTQEKTRICYISSFFYYCQLYYHFLYHLLISIFVIMVSVIIDLTFPNASELVNLSFPCPSHKMVPNSPIWAHSNLKCIAKLSKGWDYQLYFREGKALPLESVIALFLISQFLHFATGICFRLFACLWEKLWFFFRLLPFQMEHLHHSMLIFQILLSNTLSASFMIHCGKC